MIVYNAKVIFIIQSKHVCSYYFPWFGRDVVMNDFFSWLGLLKMKAYSSFL